MPSLQLGNDDQEHPDWLLRIPALHGVSGLGVLVLLGDGAPALAEELSEVPCRVQIEEDSEEGQLAACLTALLDRREP